jgi:hypothetical protein
MRTGNLAKVAAEAEILRIKHMLKRQGIRAGFGLVAAVFVLADLVLIDVVIWQLLRMIVAPIFATLILLVVNLLLSVVFGVLAAKSSPGQTEREALAIRQRAVAEARNSLALGTLVPVIGTLFRWRRSGVRGLLLNQRRIR